MSIDTPENQPTNIEAWLTDPKFVTESAARASARYMRRKGNPDEKAQQANIDLQAEQIRRLLANSKFTEVTLAAAMNQLSSDWQITPAMVVFLEQGLATKNEYTLYESTLMRLLNT